MDKTATEGKWLGRVLAFSAMNPSLVPAAFEKCCSTAPPAVVKLIAYLNKNLHDVQGRTKDFQKGGERGQS